MLRQNNNSEEVDMKETAGKVFSIAQDRKPVPGCTTSVGVHDSDALAVIHFSLAADTDISAETHPDPKLLVVAAGSMEAYATDGRTWQLSAGDGMVTPTDVPVGMRSKTGCVYTEVIMRKETTMNNAIKAGDVFKLADLLPYQEGTIVNMDVAHNSGMKLALMSFDAGTGLSEHSAPGEALIFALDGEGVIGYEGEEHVIHAGENFKFDKNGRHFVRADKRFKMALLLTLE
jgi:quercetin dioxygenase-like cupin family protein